MMKRIGIYVLLSSTGMILLLLGLFSEKPMQSGILATVGIIVLGISAAKVAPLLARKEVDEEGSKIEWQDERNTVIREKAAWYSGMTLIVAMSVSAFVLVLADQLIVGLLLLYSLSIIAFSAYFRKKL